MTYRKTVKREHLIKYMHLQCLKNPLPPLAILISHISFTGKMEEYRLRAVWSGKSGKSTKVKKMRKTLKKSAKFRPKLFC